MSRNVESVDRLEIEVFRSDGKLRSSLENFSDQTQTDFSWSRAKSAIEFVFEHSVGRSVENRNSPIGFEGRRL